ncbi:hypothetical protein ABT120_53395 [Nonomuraea angiospora]|uniref:hypothetical protein n=1 Tax=Nonomuraea angiospora TaxID=46172 RepID=UPI00332F00E9
MADVDRGAPGAAELDLAIPDDEVVYRRLKRGDADWIFVDSITGARRPTSGAFLPDEDGVSVYRFSVLKDNGLSASALIREPDNQIASVEVGDVRTIEGLDVHDDPWPPGTEHDEPDHLRHAAHALIVGWDGLSRKARYRAQKAIATLPSMQIVYV